MATLAATASFAQSSVSLYGNLDQAVFRTKNNNGNIISSNSNAGSTSLWGITGTEDLGGGTRAAFDLKSELTLASGQTGSSTTGLATGSSAAVAAGGAVPANAGSSTANVFNRGAWLGLNNKDLGDFKIGRQNDVWWEQTTKFNNTGINSFGWANATAAVSGAANTHLAALSGGAGVNNALAYIGTNGNPPTNPTFTGTGAAFKTGVAYTTPTLYGFTGKIQKGVPKAQVGINSDTNNGGGFSLAYDQGPLNVAYAQNYLNDGNGDKAVKQTMIAGKYAVGPYTFTLAQNQTRLGGVVQLTDAHDADVTAFGVGYALSPKWNVDVGYTTLKDKINSANKYNQVGIVGKYAFSKRTSWYVGYGRGSSEGAANFTGVYGSSTKALAADGSSLTGANSNATQADTSIITGIRHQF